MERKQSMCHFLQFDVSNQSIAQEYEAGMPQIPALFGARPIDVTTPIADLDTVVQTFGDKLRLPATFNSA